MIFNIIRIYDAILTCTDEAPLYLYERMKVWKYECMAGYSRPCYVFALLLKDNKDYYYYYYYYYYLKEFVFQNLPTTNKIKK